MVAVNCASRIALGRGINVTTTLFTTLSWDPIAQYTKMIPSTRVFRQSSVAAPLESTFAASVSLLVMAGAMWAISAATHTYHGPRVSTTKQARVKKRRFHGTAPVKASGQVAKKTRGAMFGQGVTEKKPRLQSRLSTFSLCARFPGPFP